MRLNKYLALHLGISRREADDIIEMGRAKINGVTAVLGSQVNDNDLVIANNKEVSTNTKYQYLALHKPIGYVCSRRRQGDTPTIYELLPQNLHDLKTVGRLDKNSSGLILLTNDGDFAYQMTHPKFAKVKIYKVKLDKELEPLHQQMISDHGLQLEDGFSKITLESDNERDRRYWTATMKEGRNRQVRRTFRALGYIVVQLHRTNFGNYSLGDIEPGKYEDVLMR